MPKPANGMRGKHIFGFALFLLLSPFLFAQNWIHYTNDINGNYIGNYIDVNSISDCQTSYPAIKNTGTFTASSSNVPNLGTSSQCHWSKFGIINHSDDEHLVINIPYPTIDEACIYIEYKDKVDSICIIENNSIKSRKYTHQNLVFDLYLSKEDSALCYLKVSSKEQLLLPVTIGPYQSIIQFVTYTDLISGIYFGFMIVMFFYNLFVFISIRDRGYFHYIHYIFWVTLTQATLLGYGHRFLWINNNWLTENMVFICGALSGITTIQFVKSFLQTQKNAPRANLVLNIIILFDFIALMLSFAKQYIASYNTINATAGIGSLLVLTIATVQFRKGSKAAGYFLLAWSIFLAGIIVYVLKDVGVLEYNIVTTHSLQFGSAIEAALLSLALADRINVLKKEKEDSQKEALEIAQENARIIREQNVILEKKVAERTEELSTTLENLKETQTQLVESEKMASLGQLTAGIAHEINNPINFVSSNINPLKRDVQSLIEMINLLEEIAYQNNDAAAKKQQVEHAKKEIDFDYLKTEIDFLMKGIADGSSRTAEIVKGLRVFSRLDEDALKYADIKDGLESTLVILNSHLNTHIELVRNYGIMPEVECYPGKLNQVFLNVLNNAIQAIEKKFNHQKGGVLTITTFCTDTTAFISIKDNGIGIPDEIITKIFDPFFTTKEVGQGTGLGLSIAYNTIKKHSGKIQVLSTINEGSEFIIEIPLKQ